MWDFCGVRRGPSAAHVAGHSEAWDSGFRGRFAAERSVDSAASRYIVAGILKEACRIGAAGRQANYLDDCTHSADFLEGVGGRAPIRLLLGGDGRADSPPGRGDGAPACVDSDGGPVIRLDAAQQGAPRQRRRQVGSSRSRGSFASCWRSVSALCAGGGQPLVEPDGLVSVGAPRME